MFKTVLGTLFDTLFHSVMQCLIMVIDPVTYSIPHLFWSEHTAMLPWQVLEQLKQRAFDLILMDLQMPEMDGISATLALRVIQGGK